MNNPNTRPNTLAGKDKPGNSHPSVQGEGGVPDDKYRALFDTMAQGVTFQDREGKITEANPAAEAILGLTLD